MLFSRNPANAARRRRSPRARTDQSAVDRAASGANDLKNQIAQLESMIAGLSEEKSNVEEQYAAIPVFRQPEAVTADLGSSDHHHVVPKQTPHLSASTMR